MNGNIVTQETTINIMSQYGSTNQNDQKLVIPPLDMNQIKQFNKTNTPRSKPPQMVVKNFREDDTPKTERFSSQPT